MATTSHLSSMAMLFTSFFVVFMGNAEGETRHYTFNVCIYTCMYVCITIFEFEADFFFE